MELEAKTVTEARVREIVKEDTPPRRAEKMDQQRLHVPLLVKVPQTGCWRFVDGRGRRTVRPSPKTLKRYSASAHQPWITSAGAICTGSASKSQGRD
eukprot:744809-Amphidinium_carterae.2